MMTRQIAQSPCAVQLILLLIARAQLGNDPDDASLDLVWVGTQQQRCQVPTVVHRREWRNEAICMVTDLDYNSLYRSLEIPFCGVAMRCR